MEHSTPAKGGVRPGGARPGGGAILAPLARLTERHGCAVLAVRHLNKSRRSRSIRSIYGVDRLHRGGHPESMNMRRGEV